MWCVVVGVWYCTHNIIILNPVRLAPRTHDPGIVERNDGHDVDALGLKRRQVLDVAGEMLCAAAGGEGAGDGEEDDFLVGPFGGSVVGDWDSAGGDVVG